MNLLFDTGPRPLDSVLHPTDLSQASERAFHHALAIALRHGARFTLAHAVGRRQTDNWPDFPSVRDTLDRWRGAGSLRGLERGRTTSVRKVELEIRDPVAACMHYIGRHSVDLVVMATTGRRGLARLVRAPRAEMLARKSKLLTLFLPDGGRTFVDAETGRVGLHRILIPVDPATDPRPAMVQAVQAASLLDGPRLEISLLHVGEEGDMAATEVPELPYCRWQAMQRTGDIIPTILSTADELSVDAIYMTTTWSRAGFGRVEGNVTEGVLAGAPCPVMAVPVTR